MKKLFIYSNESLVTIEKEFNETMRSNQHWRLIETQHTALIHPTALTSWHYLKVLLDIPDDVTPDPDNLLNLHLRRIADLEHLLLDLNQHSILEKLVHERISQTLGKSINSYAKRR